MLFSLCRHTKESVCVYLLKRNLQHRNCVELSDFLKKKCHARLNVIDMDSYFDSMPLVHSQFSVEIYYRLVAQFVLPECLSRILWLDSDIIVKKDISSFYHQEMGEKSLVVCKDGKDDQQLVKELKSRLGIPITEKYFNSGVLLMNLERLRRETSIDMIDGFCKKYRSLLTYPDQDLLNVMYRHQVIYADWRRYNCQILAIDQEFLNSYKLRNVSILHYTGPDKPWHLKSFSKLDKYYWHEMLVSGRIVKALYCSLYSVCSYYAHRIYRIVRQWI